jgi:DNA-binding winged helix-turn-helix (wHTH) protein
MTSLIARSQGNAAQPVGLDTKAVKTIDRQTSDRPLARMMSMASPDTLRYTRIALNHGSSAAPAVEFGTLIPDPPPATQAAKIALDVGFLHLDNPGLTILSGNGSPNSREAKMTGPALLTASTCSPLGRVPTLTRFHLEGVDTRSAIQGSNTDQPSFRKRTDPAVPAVPSEIAFGPFRLLPAQLLLLEGDIPVLYPESRALQILVVLLERPSELVSKRQLMGRVWPNVFVEPANLTVHISPLRRALRDGRDGNRFIINVSRRSIISDNRLENAADETLCHRWRDHHDISAAHQLAKRYRRLVVRLAEIHRASGLPWDDLTGEGQLGLMRALCRFDPDQGVGFTTYATWWVAFTLQEYVLKNVASPFGRARGGELLWVEFGCPPIRQPCAAAKPDLRPRQQTTLATVAFNTHRRVADATCRRI